MSIPSYSYKLTKEQLASFHAAVVYAWKRGEEILYIGCTGNIFMRLSSHNIIGKTELLLDEDEILVWSLGRGDEHEDYQKGLALEAKLIEKFHPKYNAILLRGPAREITCVVCKKPFMQKRWWQKNCSKKCRSGIL